MPVDIASGNLHIEFVDASITGKVNLVWDRRYSGNLLMCPAGCFGAGWTTRYHATLTRREGGFEFFTPAGSVEWLPDTEGTVERGAVIRDLGAQLEIFMQAGRYIVQSWGDNSEVQRYSFIPSEPSRQMHLASIENLAGQGLDLHWDENGRLIRVCQCPEQRELHLDYSASGLLITVSLKSTTGKLYRIVQYEYNDYGQLIAAFDALDYAHRYEYDQNGQLVRELAKDGGIFSYRYDDKGRCFWTFGLDRYDEKRLRFLDSVRITEVTDSYGSKWQYQYLPTGQIVSEWNPVGEETKTEYDPYGRIIAKTTPNGATTRYEYDDLGNISKIIDPLGATYSFSYNENHQPTVVCDPIGGIWRRHYDTCGYLIEMENPLGGRTLWDYDADGNNIRTIAPDGAITLFKYHNNGVLHQVIDPGGAIRSVLFDDFGRPIMNINPMAGTVQTSYDACGRVVEVRGPDGTTLTYQYDAAGNIIRKTDRQGQTTSYEWGTCGRLIRKTDALGQTISYEWGSEIDRLLTVVNEIGESLRLSYDAAGRIVEEQSFDGRIRKFAYDPNGALASYTTGEKDTLEFLYDPCGHVIGQRLSDGSLEDYEYDLLGRLIVAKNAHCTITYTYDPLGNIIEEHQDDIDIISDFDNAGRLLRRRSSLGFDMRSYVDKNGRPSKIELLGRNSFSFTYDAAGSEVSRSLPGGLCLAQDRDERGRVIRQFVGLFSYKTTTSNVEGFLRASIARSFRYDGNNAPVMINDRRKGTSVYTYDPAEQLISAEYELQKWEKFEYTQTGGISRITSPTSDVHLEYGKGNRLLRVDNTDYDYDDSGRRIRKTVDSQRDGNWIYSWDSVGRLRSVTVPSGDVWTYSYDALGRRIAKKGPQGTTRFVWCDNTLLHTISATGDIESWLFDESNIIPIAKIKNEQVYSVIPDHLGVPQELIDSNGNIVWSAKLLAWGDVSASDHSEIDCPIRFPGQWFDAESGLHYNRYRYYDPEIGQFISQDPIGVDGGLNLYRYVPNPLNYIDLLGLDVCANRKKGEDFKNAVKEELEKAGLTVVEEVTIKVDASGGSVRTRVDLFVIDANGNPVLIECKASSKAPYTPNQTKAGVPGGTLSGSAEYRTNKGGLNKGDTVPSNATTVTVRPGDPIPLTGPPPVTAPHPPP